MSNCLIFKEISVKVNGDPKASWKGLKAQR